MLISDLMHAYSILGHLVALLLLLWMDFKSFVTAAFIFFFVFSQEAKEQFI